MEILLRLHAARNLVDAEIAEIEIELEEDLSLDVGVDVLDDPPEWWQD